MSEFLPTPDKDQIALLESFERLGLPRITVVSNAQQAQAALATLATADVLGFDTESKPTFAKDEVSTGPHIVQLSTAAHAWVWRRCKPGLAPGCQTGADRCETSKSRSSCEALLRTVCCTCCLATSQTLGSAPAGVRAVLDLIPNLFPFFSPGEWVATVLAHFAGQVGLFLHPHIARQSQDSRKKPD